MFNDSVPFIQQVVVLLLLKGAQRALTENSLEPLYAARVLMQRVTVYLVAPALAGIMPEAHAALEEEIAAFLGVELKKDDDPDSAAVINEFLTAMKGNVAQ